MYYYYEYTSIQVPHLDKGAVEHVRHRPFPRRAHDLATEALGVRPSICDGRKQVLWLQLVLSQDLLHPEEEDIRELMTITQLRRRPKEFDGQKSSAQDKCPIQPIESKTCRMLTNSHMPLSCVFCKASSHKYRQ